MLRTYTCADCGTVFEATRSRCPIRGTVGDKIDGRTCRRCGVSLEEGPYQRCPSCGSVDVVPVAVGGRP